MDADILREAEIIDGEFTVMNDETVNEHVEAGGDDRVEMNNLFHQPRPTKEDIFITAGYVQAATMWASRQWEVLEFDDDFKQEATMRLAPGVAKLCAMGGDLDKYCPPWVQKMLTEYKPLLDAGLYLGATVYGCMRKVKEHNKQEAEKSHQPESKEPQHDD